MTDDWEQLTEGDMRALKSAVELELQDEAEEELKAFEKLAELQLGAGSPSASSGSGAALPVKTEGVSAGQAMADKIEAVKASSSQHIARLRTISLEVRTYEEKAKREQEETQKLQHAIFVTDCEKCGKLACQAVRVLERLCINGEKGCESQLPKLIHTIKVVDDLIVDIESWANKFGFREIASRGGKRKRK